MPCRSDYMLPTPQEIQADHDAAMMKVQQELDRLTHENDRLREIIIKARGSGFVFPDATWAWVTKGQVEHRKEDLKRLEKTLRAAIADQRAMGRDFVGGELTSKLGAVVSADPSKPLKEQLGFDPDSI